MITICYRHFDCNHIVQLLGVIADYEPVYLVMELMEEGDLKTYLQRYKKCVTDQVCATLLVDFSILEGAFIFSITLLM